eukprot:764240-Hanusia_phi.AAC.9
MAHEMNEPQHSGHSMHSLPCQTKICYFDVLVLRHTLIVRHIQQVFWLEISAEAHMSIENEKVSNE